MKHMKLRDTRYNHAGMFRCCVQSLEDWVLIRPDAEVSPGAKTTCEYCDGDGWELDDLGIWRAAWALHREKL